MVKIEHEFQRIDVNNDHSSKLHYTDQANLSMNQPFTNNPRVSNNPYHCHKYPVIISMNDLNFIL